MIVTVDTNSIYSHDLITDSIHDHYYNEFTLSGDSSETTIYMITDACDKLQLFIRHRL